MTPEQLREEADVCEQDYAAGHPIDIGAPEFIRLARAHADALEEVERLKAERDAAFAMSKCECESSECCANLVKAHERAEQAERRAERLQAKVDALMLEYCPDEMTPEQVEEWTRHQMAVAFDRADKGE